MRQPFRRHPGHTRITVVIVRINIGLCLFGLAAIITAFTA